VKITDKGAELFASANGQLQPARAHQRIVQRVAKLATDS